MIAIADLKVLACEICVGKDVIVAMGERTIVEIELIEDEDAPKEA